MKKEVWKDIANYEGLYQISNFGKIRRTRTKKLVKVKSSKKKNIYQEIELIRNKEHKRYFIHKLVALHFIPNPNPSVAKEIRHIDGNKLNNKASNLEWVRISDMRISHIQYIPKFPFGRMPRPVKQIDMKTGEVIETYESVSEAGRCFANNNYGRIVITNCLKGRVKSAYGFYWQYVN